MPSLKSVIRAVADAWGRVTEPGGLFPDSSIKYEDQDKQHADSVAAEIEARVQADRDSGLVPFDGDKL